MFWHKAMFDGIGTQREELRGSHSPSSPIESMDLKPVVDSGSPHASPSCPSAGSALRSPNPISVFPSIPALPLTLSLTPDRTLPSALIRSSSPALNLSGPSDIASLGPASKRRNKIEAEWEDFLEINGGQGTPVILGEQLEWRNNPDVFLLSESRPLCESAGEEGRIGVFIVGGDYICLGRDKGRCREQ